MGQKEMTIRMVGETMELHFTEAFVLTAMTVRALECMLAIQPNGATSIEDIVHREIYPRADEIIEDDFKVTHLEFWPIEDNEDASEFQFAVCATAYALTVLTDWTFQEDVEAPDTVEQLAEWLGGMDAVDDAFFRKALVLAQRADWAGLAELALANATRSS